MGREMIVKYYDDELFEMIPSSQSEASLQDMRWNNYATNVSSDKETGTLKLWNEDFSHRPSWCDAHLALQQIKNGKAKGNKPALYVRAFLQVLLFKLGCFMQRRSAEVIFVGLLILCLFSIGLRDAYIESNMEKLWVEKGGRLAEEREYVRLSFSGMDPNKYMFSPEAVEAENDELSGGGSAVQYLVLIQTPRKKFGHHVINKQDLLLHEETLRSIAGLTVDLFNETWSLSDICFKPTVPAIPEAVREMFENFLNTMIPCVILTPLDCYWEGSKPNGPVPPFVVPGFLKWVLSSLENFDYLDWGNIDPTEILNDASELDIKEIDSVKSLFKRAGIEHGYVNRPCIEPLDPGCPKTAPNYFNICPIVDKILQYNFENNNVFKLINDMNIDGASDNTTSERKIDNCSEYGPPIRKILLENQKVAKKFMPESYESFDYAKVLTGGCTGFAQNYMRWPEDLIVGGVTRNKNDENTIKSIEALQSVFMISSAQDVYERVKKSHTHHLNMTSWSKKTAGDVLAKWQRRYTSFIYNHLNNSDDQRLLHPLAGTSVNDMLKEFSKFNPTVIIIGYVFMIFYASLSLCSCADHGIRSAVGLGFAGCLLVTFAGVAGLGCSMLLGIPFNAATTQIVPFLTLGLGVDDMFLLVHNYKEIVKQAKKDEIGFLLKETGLSALLTSLNNILAFLAGGLMPVPALRDFCLQVAILLFFNALSILTIYPAMMSLDIRRRKGRRVDIFCCVKISAEKMSKNGHKTSTSLKTIGSCASTELANRGGSRVEPRDNVPPPAYNDLNRVPSENVNDLQSLKSSSQSYLTAQENVVGPESRKSGGCNFQHWTLHRFVKFYYNVWMAKMPIKGAIIIGHLIILSFGIIGCTKVSLGLELTDVIPQGTAPYAFLDARDDYFSFYPFHAVVKGPTELQHKQSLLREYRSTLSRVSYVIKKDGKVQEQFWLDMFQEWLRNLQIQFHTDLRNKTLIINDYYVQNQSNADQNADISHLIKNKGCSEDSIMAFKLLCNVGNFINCSRAKDIQLVDDNGIINVDGFYNYLTAWYNQDPLTYYVSQANFYPKPVPWNFTANVRTFDDLKIPVANDLVYSQIAFFLNRLVDTPTIVDMIQQIRSICEEFDKIGLPNFPEGIAFTFWEQYLHLRWNLIVALLIVIGSVFVVISFLLMNPWTSALVAIVLVLLVVELAGFMGLVGLKLNAVSAVSLITAVGIGVEFTVHVSLSYLTALGSRNERMARTMEHMFIPVLHGGLSTLLGVIMLAFSEFEFIVRYFFMVMSALIVLGLLNGLLLLPVLLSLVGPKSEVRTVDGSHYLPPPSPRTNRKQHEMHSSQEPTKCVEFF